MADRPGEGLSSAPGERGPEALAIINARAVAELLSLSEAIEVVALAMKDLSRGLVNSPERFGLPVSPESKMVLMPGAMAQIERFGIKTLSLHGKASLRGFPSHQGVMLLFDCVSGRPLCAIDSHAITELRTAAATAVATRELARAAATSVALVGCGSLARLHLEAMLQVRPIENCYVWSRTRARARAFAADASSRFAINVQAIDDVRETIENADVICTLTASDFPVVEGKWLRPGQHLNLVGASTRASREVDDDAVARAYYVADSRAHALSQAGELRHAIAQGRVQESHIAGEIGEILNGVVASRPGASAITAYKSLGHIAQDIRVADALFGRLDRSKQVVWVPWPA